MPLPLRIMTKDFELIDEIDMYSSLQITRSWHGIGILELHINKYLRGADKLLKDRIIFPHNHLNKAYVIKYREIALDSSGKQSENWIIRALPLKSWTAQRLTAPPSTTGYDNKQGDAETVMLHYINKNVINPMDPANIIPNLANAINLERGPTVSWRTRYKNLAEEIAQISLISGLGWNVEIDKDHQQFLFKILEGRDLTANQSILPPAIFSPEFGTLGQMSFVESDLNYKNHAIVAGQGEGVERRIVEVGTASGLNRHTIFVDARDVAEETEDEPPVPRPVEDIEAELTTRGLQALTDYQQELYLEGQVLTKSRLVYGTDYDLGDMVTLQNKEWGITLDARITEVKEIYEPNNTSLEVVFNQKRPTLIQKIRQEISGLKIEERR